MRTILILLFLPTIWSCSASEQQEINEHPKYGFADYHTIWERSTSDQRARLAQESQAAAERGWRYLREQDLAMAIKRFNQAWTLHPENPRALWGMAIVMFERAKRAADGGNSRDTGSSLDEAVALVDEALSHGASDPSLLTDAALIHATKGGFMKSAGLANARREFNHAEGLLKRAESIASHPQIDRTWAVLERYRGRISKAEEHERRAELRESEKEREWDVGEEKESGVD